MKKIGAYWNREIYWSKYSDLLNNELPNSDWICLFTCSKSKPSEKEFNQFTRLAINNKILEFKGHGKYGETLHDWFDETLIVMETMENHPEIEVMTTWHNKETLADTFWQCFFATCLPDSTNYKNLKIICSDLDGINRTIELEDYLERFKKGWLPKDKTESWEPIEFNQLNKLINQGVDKMTLEQKEIWNQISIHPIKWEEDEYGEDGNGFWVVGISKGRVIWYNDIEEGFNISTYTKTGKLDEYAAKQDELQWTIRKLATTP